MIQPTALGGQTNQPFVNRAAIDRRTARSSLSVATVLAGLLFFSIAGNVYVGSQPKEKPVIIKQLADGSYMPYAENAAPDVPSESIMLTHWFICYRSANPDPRSICGTTTRALLDGRDAGGVLSQVRAYDQQVTDTGAVVTVQHVNGVVQVPSSPFEFRVTWDETVKTGPRVETHNMFANVTVAFADGNADLHNDALLNPFGMYIETLDVHDEGATK